MGGVVVGVGVLVGVSGGVGVAVGVRGRVGAVGVPVGVGVAVTVGAGVAVSVAVCVGVLVGVDVGMSVGVTSRSAKSAKKPVCTLGAAAIKFSASQLVGNACQVAEASSKRAMVSCSGTGGMAPT